MDEKNKKINDKPFINETIRRKPINKRKFLWRLVLTAVSAVLFGVIACVTFLVMEPIIGGVISPEKVTKISFPEEEVPVESLLTEESIAQKEEADKQEVLDAARKEAAKEVEIAVKNDVSEESPLERYAGIYDELSALAKASQSYMVTVIAANDATDWLAGTYETEQVFSGVIIADNGLQYFVLADLADRSASRYTIRFYDGSYMERPVLRRDPQTGLAIFSIPKSGLPRNTLLSTNEAVLGNSSYTDLLGKPVIAVGSPQGLTESVSYGTVTSENAQLRVTDGVYDVMLTDIAGSDQSSGVLINLEGKIVGVITKSAQSVSSSGGTAAVGISEIKTLMAKMSNDEQMVYLGVKGMAVSMQAHEELQIPFGAYVTDVEVSSPAMQAGIRNADIIVQIGDSTISSFKELRTVLLTMSPGEEKNITIMRFDGQQYQQIETQVMLQEATE